MNTNQGAPIKIESWTHSRCHLLLEYIEPMYRGPFRGPCIGTIYPTLLGFGGIQAIILSYSLSYSIYMQLMEANLCFKEPSLSSQFLQSQNSKQTSLPAHPIVVATPT